MRIISAPAIAALESGRYGVRCLFKIMLHDSSVLAVWDDVGNISLDGDTYIGAAGRFTIEATTSVSDQSSRGVDVSFSGLDAAVVAMIDGAPWHQAPVLIQRIIIATDEPAVLHVMPEFSGFADQIEWRESVGGSSVLKIKCESASRELSRSGGRTSSDTDQRDRDPSDGIFSYAVSAVTTNFDWGKAPEQAPPRQSGVSRFLSKLF